MARASPVHDLAIVGGGIAGLSAAHEAVDAGAKAVLLESSARVGGKMTSTRSEGFLLEHGPHSFRHNATRLWELVARSRVRARVIRARRPSYRYIYRGGRLRRLPTGPAELLRGDWLSTRGKIRALCEPLVPRRVDEAETLADFARRRFGAEVASGLLAPFVSGIYAGDIEQLTVADAFPSLHSAERDHGSVLGGVLRGLGSRDNEHAPGRGVFSFDTGMGGLAEAIAAQLPDEVVQTRCRVTRVEQRSGAYRLKVSIRDHSSDKTRMRTVAARRVLLALPLSACRRLLSNLAPQVAERAPVVDAVPIALVHLGGPDPERIAPRGFGCLVGRGEGVEALGILFPSASFGGRALGGGWLHSVFVGGAHHRGALQRTDAELVEVARQGQQRALRDIDGGRLSCSFSQVVRYDAGIPQYVRGHRADVRRFRGELSEQLPGVYVAGAFFDGISVGDAAQSGAEVASHALSWSPR